MTLLEGLTVSDIPYSQVLSVSVLLSFTSLFPVGLGFILRVIYMPDIPRAGRFLTFLTLISRGCS